MMNEHLLEKYDKKIKDINTKYNTILLVIYFISILFIMFAIYFQDIGLIGVGWLFVIISMLIERKKVTNERKYIVKTIIDIFTDYRNTFLDMKHSINEKCKRKIKEK